MTGVVPTGDAVAVMYLLRHGRTAFNAAGMLRGHADVDLDEVGMAEAERLGEVFSAVPLGLVVAST
ncbi:MAG TPA: histidine phosphatase family protein [Acidimicrobiales bacterium]|nr:histidine phosphatase family protein [Acidimicrobiales bacterium]